MIKQSYLQEELKELRIRFGASNIFLSEDNGFLMIQNFPVPGFFKKKETCLVFEIPAGFGFGVNVFNSYILLNRKFEKKHLYTFQKKFSEKYPGLESHFHIQFDSGTYRADRWFWLCFHMWGDPVFEKSKGVVRIGKPHREDAMVGLLEYTGIIRLALDSIARGDKKMLLAVRDMSDQRQNLLRDHKISVEQFILERNWKKLRWMYGLNKL